LISLQSVERRALDFLAELCATYSPAGREAAVLPPLEAELRRLGAEVRLLPVSEGRANVLATWGQPRILFSSHLDVVPPEIPLRRTEASVQGRGACDAKGQIAAQLAAIGLLIERGVSGLAWLGVCGEETDSAGANAAIGAAGANAAIGANAAAGALAPRMPSLRAIINGEPTNCVLATGQKGFLRVRLSCEGKAAHGATPELGENALIALMDWIDAVRKAEGASDPQLGDEAWNLGILSGGRAANVVPDRAEAELAIRTVPGGRLRKALEAARPPRGRLQVLVEESWALFDVPAGFPSAPVPFGSDLPALRELAPKAAAILAGPGRPELAHTGVEELTAGEMSAGIALFRDLGLRYAERYE
jgi:acetylornithine deacetylase